MLKQLGIMKQKLQYLNKKKHYGNIFYALQTNVKLIFCSYYKINVSCKSSKKLKEQKAENMPSKF